ncbi:SAG family member [Eimeria mitis]|uniref:SAG family member n=1 Tax=Eimeria mitis TaxID=44415 RepID=U6KBU3_9EIME|nr:SAG family member [Eimeria mitis]CDJ32938.1 SAG family member [Eimeria mitis]
MAGLKFLPLVTAAIFLLGANGANTSNGAATGYKADRVDCSASMNAARNLVGFADFTVGKTDGEKLPIDEALAGRDVTGAAYVNSVCTALKDVTCRVFCVLRPSQNQQNTASAQESATLAGTYAYAVQEGASADCKAAVDHWKAALSNFKSLPPQYTGETAPYADPQNISFISLFNPNENPKVDCAYFTCPAQQADSQQRNNVSGGDGEGEGEGDEDPEVDSGVDGPKPGGEGGSTTDKEVKALVCVTTPKALNKDAAPYTQAQWDQITAGLNKNAAPALPTFLGFAATAVGILLL